MSSVHVTLGPQITGAPRWGQRVALVRGESLIVATVQSDSPRGGHGYVRLSDGTQRAVAVGHWFPVIEERTDG